MKNERDPVTGKPIYTLASGISLMIFYAFAMMCMSTFAVVKKGNKNLEMAVYTTNFDDGIGLFGSLDCISIDEIK